MDFSGAVVCSSHPRNTSARHVARGLREQLEKLNLACEFLEIDDEFLTVSSGKSRGMVKFVFNIAEKYPSRRIFWLDWGSNLISFSPLFLDSTADIVLVDAGDRKISDSNLRCREETFRTTMWGLGTSRSARKFIEDAHNLSVESALDLSDEYVLSEALIANASSLSVQTVPSAEREERSSPAKSLHSLFSWEERDKQAHLDFGSESKSDSSPSEAKRGAHSLAKSAELLVPENARLNLRRLSDFSGFTGLLVAERPRGLSRSREGLLRSSLSAIERGDIDLFDEKIASFRNLHVPGQDERTFLEAADALRAYAVRNQEKALRLAWWSTPYPGNFGDWLSPLIFSRLTDAGILLRSPMRPSVRSHLFGIGSIARFIGPKSVVVGTGVNDSRHRMSPNATYISARGPITAEAVRASGGPVVTQFGDPAIVLSELHPVGRAKTNGRIALVRHYAHASLPVRLAPNMDEIGVMMSSPSQMKAFLDSLNTYDGVLTSAMHVMIACHSYGIPCGLITFRRSEGVVRGTGVKYLDYSRGAEVDDVIPISVELDLTELDINSVIRVVEISKEKKQQVLEHLRLGIKTVISR